MSLAGSGGLSGRGAMRELRGGTPEFRARQLLWISSADARNRIDRVVFISSQAIRTFLAATSVPGLSDK